MPFYKKYSFNLVALSVHLSCDTVSLNLLGALPPSLSIHGLILEATTNLIPCASGRANAVKVLAVPSNCQAAA
jgi:hypothetical protein